MEISRPVIKTGILELLTTINAYNCLHRTCLAICLSARTAVLKMNATLIFDHLATRCTPTQHKILTESISLSYDLPILKNFSN